ncbi:MAG: hypothetical protein ACR2Q3_04930 [Woeseiaceae bacterium]
MHKRRFADLQHRLLGSGVAAIHVRRIIVELSDHFDDLRLEALANGASSEAAQKEAESRLGDQADIADRILERTELKSWPYRYPQIARIYFPLAYILLLTAAPVFVGMANSTKLARWGVALMLSGAVTAAMLLCMQLAIVLT